MRRSAVLIGLCAALATTQAAGQTVDEFTANDWMKLRVAKFVQRGMGKDMERLRYTLTGLYDSADIDGQDGITRADENLAVQKRLALARARIMKDWLSHDYDGDGSVSRAEVLQRVGDKAIKPFRSHGLTFVPTEEQKAQILEKLMREHMKDDADGDGVITFAEALAEADSKISKKNANYRVNRRRMISTLLDVDGDKIISRDEYMSALEAALKWVDKDSDGILSAEEKAAARAEYRELEARYKLWEQHCRDACRQ